jgi:hypothetical protein
MSVRVWAVDGVYDVHRDEVGSLVSGVGGQDYPIMPERTAQGIRRAVAKRAAVGDSPVRAIAFSIRSPKAG